ncbi:BA75_00386T0 [Komagataella pastoris]|uniref:BA75_00386T0 n=1 Tax=Komagataella pastoris TaxID=4922 RepID=A0A1B2J5Z8_PICPA|nr:BA75_00386T0 [Komagataella pastoris]
MNSQLGTIKSEEVSRQLQQDSSNKPSSINSSTVSRLESFNTFNLGNGFICPPASMDVADRDHPPGKVQSETKPDTTDHDLPPAKLKSSKISLASIINPPDPEIRAFSSGLLIAPRPPSTALSIHELTSNPEPVKHERIWESTQSHPKQIAQKRKSPEQEETVSTKAPSTPTGPEPKKRKQKATTSKETTITTGTAETATKIVSPILSKTPSIKSSSKNATKQPTKQPTRPKKKSQSTTPKLVSAASGAANTTTTGPMSQGSTVADEKKSNTIAASTSQQKSLVDLPVPSLLDTDSIKGKNVPTEEPVVALNILLSDSDKPNPGSAQLVFNLMKVCEEKYGFKAMHPNAKFVVESDEDDDDIAEDDEQTETDIKEVATPPHAIPKTPVAAPIREDYDDAERRLRNQNRKIGKYDIMDPFIDDSELQFEEERAATKDGFFVYYGPLIEEGQMARIERADGTLKKGAQGTSSRGKKVSKKSTSTNSAGNTNQKKAVAQSTAPQAIAPQAIAPKEDKKLLGSVLAKD